MQFPLGWDHSLSSDSAGQIHRAQMSPNASQSAALEPRAGTGWGWAQQTELAGDYS